MLRSSSVFSPPLTNDSEAATTGQAEPLIWCLGTFIIQVVLAFAALPAGRGTESGHPSSGAGGTLPTHISRVRLTSELENRRAQQRRSGIATPAHQRVAIRASLHKPACEPIDSASSLTNH